MSTVETETEPTAVALQTANSASEECSGSAEAERMGGSGVSVALPVVAVLATAFVWSYWTTILELIHTWDREADYSHGYLVVPFALAFLWFRRDLYPGSSDKVAWLGLIPIILCLLIRYVGAQWYLGSLDGWSMMFWIAGVVWMLGGWRMLWWSGSSILFLVFMVPMPWRYESLLSVPLQRIATKASCWALQFLGEPALSSGNTIFLGEQKMEVAAACAGLRIFMGVMALAFAYVVLSRRSWWERVFLLLIAPPVAVIANVTRIVVTGLLYQHANTDAAKHFFHDTAGWAMIVLAAALYGLVLWYLSWLVRDAEEVDTSVVVGRQRGSHRSLI